MAKDSDSTVSFESCFDSNALSLQSLSTHLLESSASSTSFIIYIAYLSDVICNRLFLQDGIMIVPQVHRISKRFIAIGDTLHQFLRLLNVSWTLYVGLAIWISFMVDD